MPRWVKFVQMQARNLQFRRFQHVSFKIQAASSYTQYASEPRHVPQSGQFSPTRHCTARPHNRPSQGCIPPRGTSKPATAHRGQTPCFPANPAPSPHGCSGSSKPAPAPQTESQTPGKSAPHKPHQTVQPSRHLANRLSCRGAIDSDGVLGTENLMKDSVIFTMFLLCFQ